MSRKFSDLIIEGLTNAGSYSFNAHNIKSLIHEDVDDICHFDKWETTNEGFCDGNVNEAKTVTFANNTYPKNGWAVIMAGGPGSGKGYVISHKIAIDAKIIDVDELKRQYVEAAKRNKKSGTGKIKDDRDYDFKNPKDVGDLHDIVDKKMYKEKMEDNFFSSHKEGDKPNIIYDITGSKADKLKNLGKMLKDMGYKVSLVWVVTNRQVALMRNMCRTRVVPEVIFHDVANKVNANVFPFMQSSDAKYYDEAWVVFNSADSLKELSSEEKKEFEKMSVVKFLKKGSSFVIPDDVAERVFKTLGQQENNPSSPEVYKSYSEIESDDSVFDKAKAGKTNLLK